MKDPRHHPGPAFDKASDATEAWRQQQIAALTQTQRTLYESERRKADEHVKLKERELAERRQADIEEATRRRRLAKPHLDLHPRIKGTRLEALLAKKQAAEQTGTRDPGTTKVDAFIEKEVIRYATEEVDRAHARELNLVKMTGQERLDERLGQFERAREITGEALGSFGRARQRGTASADQAKATGAYEVPRSEAIARAIARVKQKEKTRDDFQQAAGKTAAADPPMRSDAIARAVARVKASEQEQHANRAHDAGRSLTDTFNRAR